LRGWGGGGIWVRRAVEVGCWDVGGLLLGVTKGVGEGISQVSSWAMAYGALTTDATLCRIPRCGECKPESCATKVQ